MTESEAGQTLRGEHQSYRDMAKQKDNGNGRVSRRQLLKLMGAAGVAAVAAPLATSLVKQSTSASTVDDGKVTNNRLRRWAMVIDLRRCDGCQGVEKPPQCTIACIESHFIPEPMEWIEAYEHELPGGGSQFLPTPCMQCQNPPCVNVCPVGATWSTPEGPVLIDQDRCIGCRMCMAACPYERRFFTWAKPPTPPAAVFADSSPEHQVPQKRGVVYKCDFCPNIARAGRLPFCAQACPNRAIYYGDMEEDIATNGEEIVKLSKFLDENTAYRYKEDLGTKPRVYYIPGYGQDAGRSPDASGRQSTEWPWEETAKGSREWKRSGR